MKATLEGITYNRILIDLTNQEYQALYQACAKKDITPLDAIVKQIQQLIDASEEGQKNED